MITAKTPQERLRSKVRQAAEVLHEQGPISTFIHTNPLHGLEHLPFEQAVAERSVCSAGEPTCPTRSTASCIGTVASLFATSRRDSGQPCQNVSRLYLHSCQPLTSRRLTNVYGQ